MSEANFELNNKKIESKQLTGKWVISIFLLIPVNVIGISEMYFPKWTAPEWYLYTTFFLGFVGLSFLFPENTKDAKEFILSIFKRR